MEFVTDIVSRENPILEDDYQFLPDSQIRPKGRPQGTRRIISHDEI